MKLRDLLWVLNKDTVIWVAKDEHRDDGFFLGQAGDCNITIREKYLDAGVVKVYTEYYAAYNQVGISIIVDDK
jgi:hypothetical protein